MSNYEDYQQINSLKLTHPEHYELFMRIADHVLETASIGCHDIKNHAALISSYCQLLEADNPALSDEPYFDKVKLNLNHLFRLLDDIAAFRYSFDNQEKSTFALDDILNDAISAVHSDYPELSINKRFNHPKPPVNLFCHRQHMTAAFSAILLNAAESCTDCTLTHSSCPGSDTHQMAKGIDIHTSIKDEQVCIEFTDNGRGFDNNLQSCALKPFVSSKRNHSGLGLSSACNIIWQHGGNILIDNKASMVQVTVLLPVESE